MTTPIDRAYVEIVPDFRSFNNKVKTDVHKAVTGTTNQLDDITKRSKRVADESAGHFKRGFGSITGSIRSFAAPAIAAIAGLGTIEFFKGAIAEAREAQKVSAQTASVIKSTGSAAHISAGHVGDLANKISAYAGIDDEAIQSGENLLLTFTNIRNEVGKGNDIFDQATTVVTDMSVALGQDMKSSAIQVGKALNDPIKGVTALQRVGVSFTTAQKDQIKSLVNSGHALEAQKIILRELTKEFGGSAAAQATSGEKLKVAFDNVKESIGTALLPVIDKTATFISTRFVPAFNRAFDDLRHGRGIFGTLRDAAVSLWLILQPLIATVISFGRSAWRVVASVLQNQVVPALRATGGFIRGHAVLIRSIVVALVAFIAAWKTYVAVTQVVKAAQAALNLVMDANPILLIVGAVAALVAGFIYAYTHSQKFRDVVDQVLDNLQHAFANFMHAVDNVRHAWDNVFHAGENFVHGADNVIHAIANVVHAAGNLIHAMGNVAHAVSNVINFIVAAVRWINDVPNKIHRAFDHAITWLVQAGKNIVTGLFNGIKFVWVDINVWLLNRAMAVLRALGNLTRTLVQKGKDLVGGLFIGLRFVWDNVYVWLFNRAKAALIALGNLTRTLVQKGRDLLSGLFTGARAVWDNVYGWLRDRAVAAARAVGGLARTLYSKGLDLLRGLWRGARDAWDTVWNWLANRGMAAARAVGNVGHVLFDKGKAVISGFLRGLRWVWDHGPGSVIHFISGIAKWIKEHKGPVALDARLLFPAGKAMMGGFFKGLKHGWGSVGEWIKGIGGLATNLLGSVTFGPAWPVTKMLTQKSLDLIRGWVSGAGRIILGAGGSGSTRDLWMWINEALALTGTSSDWGPAIMRRIMFESGGNPRAINLNDQNAAAGNPSKGLMQVIDPTFRAYALHRLGLDRDIYNPVANIAAAINYIKARYGSIGAIDPPVQGYATGLWEAARDRLIKIHRGEMVVPSRQAEQVRAAGDGAMIDYERLGRAVAAALGGMAFRFDGDGLARIVTDRQDARAFKGGRR